MVVLVTVVRNEDDILESMLAYHLNAGVDHVLATDHRSTDGTAEILRQFERDGVLTSVREDRPTISQGEVTTAMARTAAVQLGADWVVPADADEFWWSREGPLRDVLTSLPARYTVVHGLWRHFVLRPDDDRPFHERMTLRCRPTPDLESVYQRQVKVALRADPDAVVESGNHGLVTRPAGQTLRGWYPLEVLHFPLRSRAQLERKLDPSGRGFTNTARHKVAAQSYPGGLEAFRASVCPVGVELAEGIRSRELVEDTRLRDALRAIAAGRPVPAYRPTVEDDVDFALDAGRVLEIDSAARLRTRLDALERRCEPGAARPLGEAA